MKLKSISVLTLAMITILTFPVFAQKVNYTVDVTKSTLAWEGKKFSGAHNGTVLLSTGSLSFNGKNLTGGTFSIDMASIKDADGNARLEKHLKNDDFFGVDKFPSATFVIKKVENTDAHLKITGDLTIKGQTHPIVFPVKITWNTDKTVIATAEKIIVDRTKYGIEYKSKSIFSSIGNSFIYDDFMLSVALTAKK